MRIPFFFFFFCIWWLLCVAVLASVVFVSGILPEQLSRYGEQQGMQSLTCFFSLPTPPHRHRLFFFLGIVLQGDSPGATLHRVRVPALRRRQGPRKPPQGKPG